MYKPAKEVNIAVSTIETRLTALLSRIFRPEIFFTVGPGFPTICKYHNYRVITIANQKIGAPVY